MPDLAELKNCLRALPYITAHLPGCGGVIKAEPADFAVEEVLPYAASGAGEHVFVTLTRSGWNTTDVAKALAELFALGSRDLGWAGLKDRQATVTQTFSLPLGPELGPAEIASRIAGETPFTVREVRRHLHKLRAGHVEANRFRIVIRDLAAPANAEGIAAALRQRAIPNFYGDQRFGHGFENLNAAARLVADEPSRRSWHRDLLVSAWQAAWFNWWLLERLARGWGDRLLIGDLAHKTDTGGLFEVTDLADAEARFRERRLVHTGPIFGYKMRPATGEPGALEAAGLAAAGTTAAQWQRLDAPGSRREGIVYLPILTLEPHHAGLQLEFVLPGGSYATVITREFTRN